MIGKPRPSFRLQLLRTSVHFGRVVFFLVTRRLGPVSAGVQHVGTSLRHIEAEHSDIFGPCTAAYFGRWSQAPPGAATSFKVAPIPCSAKYVLEVCRALPAGSTAAATGLCGTDLASMSGTTVKT